MSLMHQTDENEMKAIQQCTAVDIDNGYMETINI